jgi:hypothetical protein
MSFHEQTDGPGDPSHEVAAAGELPMVGIDWRATLRFMRGHGAKPLAKDVVGDSG